MAIFYRSEVHIGRAADGALLAELPGGERLGYRPHPIEPAADVPGAPAEVCSSIDHLVAAAGW